MESQETIIWVPSSHKIIMLVMGLALTAVAVYLLLTEEFVAMTLVFILTFSIGSLASLLYALKLVLAPKPTLIFDSTGLSISRSTAKAPWRDVDTIERVVAGRSSGIAIRFIETSEYKSDATRTVLDWDRKEKYDIVVWKQYCDMPLDDLQRRLLKFKEDYSETVGGV